MLHIDHIISINKHKEDPSLPYFELLLRRVCVVIIVSLVHFLCCPGIGLHPMTLFVVFLPVLSCHLVEQRSSACKQNSPPIRKSRPATYCISSLCLQQPSTPMIQPNRMMDTAMPMNPAVILCKSAMTCSQEGCSHHRLHRRFLKQKSTLSDFITL